MAGLSSNTQCSPQSQQHRLDQALSRLRQRVLERAATASATPHATKEAVVQLPWWHDLDRAIPNHLARSSLFAPVARGRRATHEGKVLTSRSDVQLRYWGMQLDEPDSDVWMQALHEARRHPVGAPVPVVRSHFLKSLGRHIGSTDYGWLHESFLRLSLGMLEIKTRKYTVGEVPGDAAPSKGMHRVLHLIDGFDLDEELDTYVLRIDRRMVRLFSIRTKLLKDGHIDTVIGLPANLFFSTGIPVCILVLKKCKKPDDVLFINAAEEYDKAKRQNVLQPEHINKIIDTYQFRKEEQRYSRRVSMEEIEKNDFNLNISRYVSTAEDEEEIDLAKVHEELVALDRKIKTATQQHNEFLKELGLPLLP